MIDITGTETSIKVGQAPDEFELQQTTTVKVNDEVDLSNTAEQLVEAQAEACGHKTDPRAKASCELQQEQLFLSSPEVSAA